MLRAVFFTISVLSFFSFFYGVFMIFGTTEENSCRMTYMFEYPQFVRIHFEENDKFPNYALYAYSEGALTERARALSFTGAPVIFVPGNKGSFKQARSLASVAIRKGIDNNWEKHLDYFSVDYNEEHSALFGGYLENQKEYLKHCVVAVLKLYKHISDGPKKVILIGHSMGGKVAESLLTDNKTSKYINTVIAIASPINEPILNMDPHFEAFYKNIDETFSQNKTITNRNDANYCVRSNPIDIIQEMNKTLDEKLLITIGGGERDILVHPGLTESKYSNLHTLTTAIPNVWLSTDHLCSVWCLQLVLVINRFLYSIVSPSKSKYGYRAGQYFIEDKATRLMKATHFFVRSFNTQRSREVNMIMNLEDIGDWVEDSRRVYSKNFKNGVNRTYIQMIRLVNSPQHRMLYAEASNLENDDWVFGCAALEVNQNQRFCSKATPLSYYVKKLPSLSYGREFIQLDLFKIMRTNSSWTHILLRINPTRSFVNLNIDIHNPSDRTTQIDMPQWYSLQEKNVLQDTALGSSFYQFTIPNMDDSHHALAISIKARTCPKSEYNVVSEICIPWARGCSKYQHITQEQNNWIYVDTPKPKPAGYNTTENPIRVNFHLDPACRYTISYKGALGRSISRMIQQYFHWFPAHITAILLLALKYQISVTPKDASFKCGSLYIALFNSSTFFIITVSRIFAKFLLNVKFLPTPDQFDQSILISALIHGTSLWIVAISGAALWLAMNVYGKISSTILFRFVTLSLPSLPSVMMKVVDKLPISAGILLISVASASCGGLALLIGCSIYITLMTNQYEGFLKGYAFRYVKIIFKKIFGDDIAQRVRSKLPFAKKPNQIEAAKEENGENLEVNPATTTEQVENSSGPETNKTDENETKVLNVVEGSSMNEDESTLTEDEKLNRELDKLIKENMERQRLATEEKEARRKEYNSISDDISRINFHMTLFLLMATMTLLTIPAVVAWAKNYRVMPKLTPDPTLIPAVTVLICASILWQLSTPGNLRGYQIVSSFLYLCAAFCVIYCQDSIYRLYWVISFVFVLITLHQVVSPRKPEEVVYDTDQELADRIEKMQALISESAEE